VLGKWCAQKTETDSGTDVSPRAPNIDAVERINRAAFMVYVRWVETEKNPRGLVLKLEGYNLHIYNNENF
jgi:hypothetical protein